MQHTVPVTVAVVTCFNPHPARRPDATPFTVSVNLSTPRMFQSSSSQKAGCNPMATGALMLTSGFNPHPARRPDATTRPLAAPTPLPRFQSSSSQKAGCNFTAEALMRAFNSFQSSSSQKAGCNREGTWTPVASTSFQSSSSQKAGCNIERLLLSAKGGEVSILIQPEGRMQHPRREIHHHVGGVSILIQPEGRMQLGITLLEVLP